MKVLVACEFSGRVRDAFRKRGHYAVSCDELPTESTKAYHVIGDVLDFLDSGWDLMIAHPPCTRLCNSGVRWLKELNLWEDLYFAISFFNLLQDAPIPKIAIENPIPHKYAVNGVGARSKGIGKYDQIIQPWQFGHGETKATCLWLKGLPKLKPTNIVDGREARIHKMSPSKNRGRLRSLTFQGIADAMAEQWG